MPPWYIEKNIGIQKYKNDPSLSDLEVAKIGKWADSGAPQGNPADMPPARSFEDANTWAIGPPDIIVSTKEILVKANSPDWWGEIESVPIPTTEDRYVSALQIREVNDVPRTSNAGANFELGAISPCFSAQNRDRITQTELSGYESIER